MSSKYYMTPEEFMYALSDSIMQAYYPNGEWTQKAHPQDIAYNAIAVLEGIAAFMTTLIHDEMRQERKNEEGLNRLMETLKTFRDTPEYKEYNDAYVDTDIAAGEANV